MILRIRLALLAPAAALLLVGCATLPPDATRDARDPFERLNRTSFAVNEGLDKAIGKPVARAYVKVVPRPLRRGVGNFMSNVTYPTVLVSNLLQGKLADAASDTGRILLNSTLGLGGLLDPARDAGLERHNEDFGQVLGKWGLASGPYLFLPLLGPSSLRDGLGQLPDEFTNGLNHIEEDRWRYGLQALRLLDDRAEILEAEGVLERAGDKYTFVRSAWMQRREFQVRDGNVPESASPDGMIEGLEDPEPEADADSSTP
jgi:phospholipid-binding lipoprotein MlaA